MTTSILDLNLHPNQLKVFRSKAQQKVVNAARGFGKTILLQTDAITTCAGYQGEIDPRSPKVAIIVMPSLVMARAVHWQSLLKLLENSPLVEDINKSEYRIKFRGKNKPDLLLRGADRQGDRLRGLNLIYAGLDEYQDVHPDVYPLVIQPALGRNHDWRCLAIGTPKGRNHHFYQFCKMAYETRGFRYFHFKSEDSPFFPRENLERARLTLPPRVYRQEHEASWEDVEGSIFPSWSNDLIIKQIPSSVRAYYLGVDWGEVHPYLTVTALTTQGDFVVVDRWFNPKAESKVPVPEEDLFNEAARLCRKYNIFRTFAPDDRPASVISLRRYGTKHSIPGLQRTAGAKRNDPGPMQRFQILDSLFYQRRLLLLDSVRDLAKDITSFHRAKDSNGLLRNEPASGQDDHSIDALGYSVAEIEYREGANLASAA